MNKVGDYTALMAGIDFVPSDPFAIVHIYKQIWYVARTGESSDGSGTNRNRTGACSTSTHTGKTTAGAECG